MHSSAGVKRGRISSGVKESRRKKSRLGDSEAVEIRDTSKLVQLVKDFPGYKEDFEYLSPDKKEGFKYLFEEGKSGQSAYSRLEEHGVELEQLIGIALKQGGTKGIINLAAFMHDGELPEVFHEQQHEIEDYIGTKSFLDAQKAGFKIEDVVKLLECNGGSRNLQTFCGLLNEDSDLSKQLQEAKVTKKDIIGILSNSGGTCNLNALSDLLNPPLEDSVTLQAFIDAEFELKEIIVILSQDGGARSLEACKNILPLYQTLTPEEKSAFKVLARQHGASGRIEVFGQLLEQHGDHLKDKKIKLLKIFKKKDCSGKKAKNLASLPLRELLQKIDPKAQEEVEVFATEEPTASVTPSVWLSLGGEMRVEAESEISSIIKSFADESPEPQAPSVSSDSQQVIEVCPELGVPQLGTTTFNQVMRDLEDWKQALLKAEPIL